MTPHHHHATAAAWSLHRSRALLADQAAIRAAEIAAEQDATQQHDGVRSANWFGGGGGSGYGDPIGRAALARAEPVTRVNRDADLLADIDTQLTGLAVHLAPTTDADPLARIHDAIPGMRPAVAARTKQALTHLDRIVRRHLGMAPDLAPMPGNPPCPACGLQMLQVQTSAPNQADWTIVCTTPCLCTGTSCQCGTPERTEGVVHIWTVDTLPAAA